jgi:uncharacterized membrane protein YphA (DoxX/SURF4 family)
MDEAGLAGIIAAIVLIIRLLVAGIFIRAGAVKLGDREEFRLAVANYKILPASLVSAAAVGVPSVEVTAGVLLLLGVLPGVVAAVLAALLVCFSAAIAVNLARGRVFDCGCDGGTAPQLISWGHVLVNVLLVALTISVSIAPPAGLELLHGPSGVFSIGIPADAGVPVVLAAALCFMSARMLSAAIATRRLLRAPEN